MNGLSNKAYAWLMATLIGSIVALALILENMAALSAAWLWIRWLVGAIAALMALYVLYLAWHQIRVRHLDQAHRVAELAQLQTERWRIEQEVTHSQEMERERLILEQMKIRLEHERLMIEANRVLLAPGHTVVFQGDAYRSIAAPHKPVIEQVRTTDPALLAAPLFPDALDFTSVLKSGWRPTVEQVYMFSTVDGPIYERMEETCHIALAGTTGGGKTNTLRLILAQFLYCHAEIYLANPNFAPVKLNGRTIEDWRPIVTAMKRPVAWQMPDIERLITNADKLVDQRRSNQQHSPLRGRDVYIALGELPAIVSRWQDAATPVERLLREARQYGVHVISEMQDALVKTLKMSSGVRDCYRNAYYYGGDPVTARALLDLQGKGPLDEVGLGDKGASMFRPIARSAVRGRVPFLSNESLYMLLGYPKNPLPDRLPDGVNAADFFRSLGIDAGIVESDLVPVERITGPLRDSRDAGNSNVYQGFGESHKSSYNGQQTPEKDIDNGFTGLPKNGVESLVETVGAIPNDTRQYLKLTDSEIEVFTAHYRHGGSIAAALQAMKKGNRYQKHASQIVRDRGLKQIVKG